MKSIPKLFCQNLSMLGKLSLIALIFTLAGCGADFFPEFVRQPTTPDPFSFASKTGVALSSTITSDPITVAGLTGATSPISITGTSGSNSKFSINDATAANATDAAGTVKNGDTVIVTHTSASALGTSTVSTLTIGNVTGTFTSTTQRVSTPVFAAATVSGGVAQTTSAVLTSVDSQGSHVISIKDSDNTLNPQFSINDANGNVIIGFTHNTLTVAVLNGRRIFVKNSSSATIVTTLTIDDVPIIVNLVP